MHLPRVVSHNVFCKAKHLLRRASKPFEERAKTVQSSFPSPLRMYIKAVQQCISKWENSDKNWQRWLKDYRRKKRKKPANIVRESMVVTHGIVEG